MLPTSLSSLRLLSPACSHTFPQTNPDPDCEIAPVRRRESVKSSRTCRLQPAMPYQLRACYEIPDTDVVYGTTRMQYRSLCVVLRDSHTAYARAHLAMLLRTAYAYAAMLLSIGLSVLAYALACGTDVSVCCYQVSVHSPITNTDGDLSMVLSYAVVS
eukprot:3370587-Rhodomonas_salina.2